jgi:hypothetical protein
LITRALGIIHMYICRGVIGRAITQQHPKKLIALNFLWRKERPVSFGGLVGLFQV